MGMAFLNKLLQRGTTSTEVSQAGNSVGDALVSQATAQYEEITAGGYAFSVITTTATASVNALPTTTAGIGLCNTAADGGRSMIIDAIFAIQITAHAVLSQYGLIYVIGQTRVAALAGALVPRKMNGMGPATDTVCVAIAGGAVLDSVTGVAIGWLPAGTTQNTSVVSVPGVVLWADMGGRVIVPPGRQFGVNIIAGDTTGTYNCGVLWHEKQLTLG